jgi:membrane fusion protein (multidrug efflux system)
VAALDTRALRPSVLRVRHGAVERVDVGLGVRDDLAERVEITSGVAAGDTLLLGQAQALSPGSVVRVTRSGDVHL